VLYLAEVKKQARTFLGGNKTDLKLLACQHSDQTWSALPSEEIIVTEEMDSASEGTLWVVQLASNRQIQGKPEIAAPEVVRQLQKLSRLSEKLKDQQEEIEKWKHALTYQSQELSRREMEIEAREADAEEKEIQLAQVERQKYEVDQAWQRLEQERSSLQDLQQRFGVFLNANPQTVEKLQLLTGRLAASEGAWSALRQSLQGSGQSVNRQQELFNRHWQTLEESLRQLGNQRTALEQRQELFELRRQELTTALAELEKAKQQLLIERGNLTSKQQLLNYLSAEIRLVDELQSNLYRLATGAMETEQESKVDVAQLEQLPLNELEERVTHLQNDLEKLVRFVNDQEEELTLQCQEVEQLEQQLSQANEGDRPNLEEELSEEQERKRMLDETLVGQRRNLKERQDILVQHLRILRRRQGIVESADNLPNINLDPVIHQLENRKADLCEQRVSLEGEVRLLQENLQRIEQMARQLEQEQSVKKGALEAEEKQLETLRQEVLSLQSQVNFYQQSLQPLQDELDRLKPNLESLVQTLDLG